MTTIPLFVVECYRSGKKVRSEICVHIFEAEERVREFKENLAYDDIRIIFPGEDIND